jgi:hypothetical protein
VVADGGPAPRTTVIDLGATTAKSTPTPPAAVIRSASARTGTQAETDARRESGTVTAVDDVTAVVAEMTTAEDLIGEAVGISLKTAVEEEVEMAAEEADGVETSSTKKCAVNGSEPRRQCRPRSVNLPRT